MSGHQRVHDYAGGAGGGEGMWIRRSCTCGWVSPKVPGWWGDDDAVKAADRLWRQHKRDAESGQGTLT